MPLGYTQWKSSYHIICSLYNAPSCLIQTLTQTLLRLDGLLLLTEDAVAAAQDNELSGRQVAERL